MLISVRTKLAIEYLTKHFEAHKEEYQQQMAGWQEKMKEYTNAVTTWAANAGAEEGKRPKQPHKPEKFNEAYKRLLKMLELHTGVDVNLEDHEFDQIILDKFNWKSTFKHNSTMYGNGVLYDDGDDDDLAV